MGSGKLLGPNFVMMNGGIIMFWMYWFGNLIKMLTWPVLVADIVIVAMGLVLLTLFGINDFNTGIYAMLICLMVWLNRLIIANGGTEEINKK